jgi:RNA polymerase sigma factor (sigma-70 family)
MKELQPKPESVSDPPVDSALRELILQARAGSREAYLALCAKYRPLLESSVARFGPSEMTMQERADMREEAERVFLCAISSFDTEQTAVDFGLYAKICLRNGLVSEWRHLNYLRRMNALPLDESIESIGEAAMTGEENPAVRMVEDENFRQLCHTVRGHLSEFENRVWWQYVTGVSVSDIARGLGRDERSVHNAIYRIRKKLRERLAPPED